MRFGKREASPDYWREADQDYWVYSPSQQQQQQQQLQGELRQQAAQDPYLAQITGYLIIPAQVASELWVGGKELLPQQGYRKRNKPMRFGKRGPVFRQIGAAMF